MQTIGERLQALLKERGVSQSELARLTDLTRQAISNICTGAEPSLATVRKLAKALDVTEGDLIDGTVPPAKPETEKPAAANG